MREFLTDDLALATTLRCEGFEPLGMVLNGQQGRWRFAHSDGLLAEVEDYQRGLATVEPRHYNRILRLTRRELFELLRRNGIKPSPNPAR